MPYYKHKYTEPCVGPWIGRKTPNSNFQQMLATVDLLIFYPQLFYASHYFFTCQLFYSHDKFFCVFETILKLEQVLLIFFFGRTHMLGLKFHQCVWNLNKLHSSVHKCRKLKKKFKLKIIFLQALTIPLYSITNKKVHQLKNNERYNNWQLAFPKNSFNFKRAFQINYFNPFIKNTEDFFIHS